MRFAEAAVLSSVFRRKAAGRMSHGIPGVGRAVVEISRAVEGQAFRPLVPRVLQIVLALPLFRFRIARGDRLRGAIRYLHKVFTTINIRRLNCYL